MITQIKKLKKHNAGILIRLDDIAANMNWDMMQKVSCLFDKFSVKPILGVIPNNRDPELLTFPKKNHEFWQQVRQWQTKGWEISIHGNDHVYDRICNKVDYLGHGGNTEFCGHTYQIQRDKIKSAVAKFKKEDVNVRSFFAPNHTFDSRTIMALQEHDINVIIDGYGLAPYVSNGTVFIPQLFYKLFALPFGIQTIQIHLNDYNEDDFKDLERFIRKNNSRIINYDEAISKTTNNHLALLTNRFLKHAIELARCIRQMKRQPKT
jgi:predicted deacetylase